MGDAENRVDSIRVRKLNSVSNRTHTFCYFKGAVYLLVNLAPGPLDSSNCKE